MYRKPASPGVLVGVPSGPYAGGSKLVDAAKLPRAARQRLADVLTGRKKPTPILHEHPRDLASRFRATWAASLAVFALTSLTAIGFADPRAVRPAGGVGGVGLPGLDVKIDVTWPASPTFRRVGLAVHAPTIAFEVALHGEAINDVASFRLTMPPPETPPVAVRPRSLFVPEPNAYSLLTARAFDRLYDELYGLFFRGDPRVPLRLDEE